MSDEKRLAETRTGDEYVMRLMDENLSGDSGKALRALCEYVADLQELVRWFDLAYGHNEPIWLTGNIYGHELPVNVKLIETYRSVIAEKGGGTTPS